MFSRDIFQKVKSGFWKVRYHLIKIKLGSFITWRAVVAEGLGGGVGLILPEVSFNLRIYHYMLITNSKYFSMQIMVL